MYEQISNLIMGIEHVAMFVVHGFHNMAMCSV